MFGIPVILAGIAFSIYGYLSHSSKSKYAPRFMFDEDKILFKETLEKSPLWIPWDQINKIKMRPLRLDISTQDSEISWGYMTNDKTSSKIKSAIRQIAESKHIEVIEA